VLPDNKFMARLYYILPAFFNYKPKISIEQFFKYGFAESKLLLVVDVINMVKRKHKLLTVHKQLQPQYRPKSATATGSRYSRHPAYKRSERVFESFKGQSRLEHKCGGCIPAKTNNGKKFSETIKKRKATEVQEKQRVPDLDLIVNAPFSTDSELYMSVLNLRQQVLRKPLGLNLFDEDLSKENEQTIISISHLQPENVIACAMMKPCDAGRVKLRQMGVSAEYQRRGIGTRIVDLCERWASENGFTVIETHAREYAQDFYLRLGYEIKKEPFIEVGIPHRFMEKSL
jgi:predicted GNAT family N-acyltransferase